MFVIQATDRMQEKWWRTLDSIRFVRNSEYFNCQDKIHTVCHLMVLFLRFFFYLFYFKLFLVCCSIWRSIFLWLNHQHKNIHKYSKFLKWLPMNRFHANLPKKKNGKSSRLFGFKFDGTSGEWGKEREKECHLNKSNNACYIYLELHLSPFLCVWA